ncbi:MAG: YkvA family protein [Tissierellaceae bacterium]|jgi:uncharacterized membrane protein YkvA (DUF1232 family)|nr:DUF1232 domain-containing protein [Tissierellia bacterium]
MSLDFEGIISSLRSKANSVYSNNERLFKLIQDSKKTLEGNKAFSELIDDVKVSIDIIKQYLKGEYTGLSKASIIMIIIGLLYLVNPLDIVPDFLLGGFIDDAAVFAYILKKIHHEIERFTEWKSKNG